MIFFPCHFPRLISLLTRYSWKRHFLDTLMGSFSVVEELFAPNEMSGSRLENIFFILTWVVFLSKLVCHCCCFGLFPPSSSEKRLKSLKKTWDTKTLTWKLGSKSHNRNKFCNQQKFAVEVWQKKWLITAIKRKYVHKCGWKSHN